MADRTPLLLIASVSTWEAQRLERSLQDPEWTLLRVSSADDAVRQLDGNGERRAVLVIDAGLLEMPHDEQWRRLRALRPQLGTVVRCLRPRPRDGRALEVHPDDVDGVREAVRWLCRPFPPAELAPALEETVA